MTGLNWGNQPIGNGYYWFKKMGNKSKIVEVFDFSLGFVEYGARVAYHGTDFVNDLVDLIGIEYEWIGPVYLDYKAVIKKIGEEHP